MPKSKTTIVLLALTTLVLIGVASLPPVRIRYHRWRLEATHEAIWSKPNNVAPNGLASFGNEKLFARYDYHRERLAELGHLFHKTYDFDRIAETEWALPVLCDILLAGGGTAPIPYWQGAEGEGAVEVWDYPDQEAKWDAFVAKHNTPDFAELHAEEIAEVLRRREAAK